MSQCKGKQRVFADRADEALASGDGFDAADNFVGRAVFDDIALTPKPSAALKVASSFLLQSSPGLARSFDSGNESARL